MRKILSISLTLQFHSRYFGLVWVKLYKFDERPKYCFFYVEYLFFLFV